MRQEPRARHGDVLAEVQSRRRAGEEFGQARLANGQRLATKIRAVEEQQVEEVEDEVAGRARIRRGLHESLQSCGEMNAGSDELLEELPAISARRKSGRALSMDRRPRWGKQPWRERTVFRAPTPSHFEQSEEDQVHGAGDRGRPQTFETLAGERLRQLPVNINHRYRINTAECLSRTDPRLKAFARGPARSAWIRTPLQGTGRNRGAAQLANFLVPGRNT